MDTSVLEDLGLTAAEAKVYVALLGLGESGAGKILEKSRLQNSVVHRALKSLEEKGAVSFVVEGKRKKYRATGPEYFYGIMEEEKEGLEKILPELRKRQALAKTNREATVYRGKRGITEIYSRMLNSGGSEYNTFGGGKHVTYEAMGEEWWLKLHSKRIAKKLPARQVFDETIRDFGERLNKMPLSKVRFLPQNFEQLTETVISGEYVAIIIFAENPYGLLIRDTLVVEGYRKNFELLWKKARE